MYLFRTRTVELLSGETDPIFGRLRFYRGLSLLKTDGLYVEVDGPTAEQIEAADIAYLGGHDYLVSDAEAAALTIAGYASLLSIPVVVPPDEDPTDTDPGEYGLGEYGTGLFGD